MPFVRASYRVMLSCGMIKILPVRPMEFLLGYWILSREGRVGVP